MVFISARFLSLLLTALAAGVVLSHVMSRAGKMEKSPCPGRSSLLCRTRFTAAGEEGRSCRDWSIPFDFNSGRSRSGKGADICFLFGWFAVSCGDDAPMGRFHQSHQRPSACIHV
jgi:hypothetical protein